MFQVKSVYVFHFDNFQKPDILQGLGVDVESGKPNRVVKKKGEEDESTCEDAMNMSRLVKVFFPPGNRAEAEPVINALLEKGMEVVQSSEFDMDNEATGIKYKGLTFDDRVALRLKTSAMSEEGKAPEGAPPAAGEAPPAAAAEGEATISKSELKRIKKKEEAEKKKAEKKAKLEAEGKVLAVQSSEQYFADRVADLERRGNSSHPHKFEVTKNLAEFRDEFGPKLPNAEQESDEIVTIAGRVMTVRNAGASLKFYDLQGDSVNLQVLVKKAEMTMDEEAKEDILKRIHRGDMIGVRGKPVRSKTNELSIQALEITHLTTCLHMLPKKFEDHESRYRKRYLDLIMNPGVRSNFHKRSRIIKGIRNYFDNLGYLEVETPQMNVIAGGATARPFKTFHNEMGIEMFMRIAPELYLKECIVGGLDRVYEIGRNFRNEGCDMTHNPEFTMMESYTAYADYNDIMNMVEEMLHQIVMDVNGSETVKYNGKEISFKRPFRRISFVKALEEKIGVTLPTPLDSEACREALMAACKDKNIVCPPPCTVARLMDRLVGELVEGECQDPCFIMDHPALMSPLAKYHREDPDLTERFELFVVGRELCNAYTELNHPIVQRERFSQQAKQKADGDDEAQELDETFLNSLEYGLPPTGGLGMGIDRLTMLLTDQTSIREVLLFPTMKPNAN